VERERKRGASQSSRSSLGAYSLPESSSEELTSSSSKDQDEDSEPEVYSPEEGEDELVGADCVCGGRTTTPPSYEMATLWDPTFIVPARVKVMMKVLEEERIAVVLGVDSVADRLKVIDQMERCCVWSVKFERPRWSDKNQAILFGHWVLHIS
jgi:hypothetical protein